MGSWVCMEYLNFYCEDIMSKHNFTKRYNKTDDVEIYSADDWLDVSKENLPREIIIEYYKKIDWMLYAMHTDIDTLNLPRDILYYIQDDSNTGTTIREAFDKILS